MTGRLLRVACHGAKGAGRAVAFLAHYARTFLHDTLVVAWEIITPGSGLAPAIVELRPRGRTPAQRACLAHLITLTPGTLVVEVLDQPPAMLVHGMHAANTDLFRTQLADLDGRLMRVLRPIGEDDR